MNEEIRMSVSSMTRNKDSKAVYVQFQDGSKSAEIALPEGRLVRNEGFSDDEIASLIEYVNNEQETIYGLAKQVNPIRAFLSD